MGRGWYRTFAELYLAGSDRERWRPGRAQWHDCVRETRSGVQSMKPPDGLHPVWKVPDTPQAGTLDDQPV